MHVLCMQYLKVLNHGLTRLRMHAGVRLLKQLVERVIRKVRPQVVMVEVDARRIGLLPPGEASEVMRYRCGEDARGISWSHKTRECWSRRISLQLFARENVNIPSTSTIPSGIPA